MPSPSFFFSSSYDTGATCSRALIASLFLLCSPSAEPSSSLFCSVTDSFSVTTTGC